MPSIPLNNEQIIPNSSLLCKMGQRDGILLPKLFWPTVRKNCSSDRKELLKFESESQEFANILRSLYRTIYSNSESSDNFW